MVFDWHTSRTHLGNLSEEGVDSLHGVKLVAVHFGGFLDDLCCLLEPSHLKKPARRLVQEPARKKVRLWFISLAKRVCLALIVTIRKLKCAGLKGVGNKEEKEEKNITNEEARQDVFFHPWCTRARRTYESSRNESLSNPLLNQLFLIKSFIWISSKMHLLFFWRHKRRLTKE